MTKWLRDWFEAIVQFMFVLIICSCAVGGFLLGKSQELDDFGAEIAMGLLWLAIGCIIGFIIAFFVCGFLATIINISNELTILRRIGVHAIAKIEHPEEESDEIEPEILDFFSGTDAVTDPSDPPPKAINPEIIDEFEEWYSHVSTPKDVIDFQESEQTTKKL